MKEFFKGIFTNFAQKMTFVIVGGMVTITVTLFTDIKSTVREYTTLPRKIEVQNHKIDKVYSILSEQNKNDSILNENLFNINQQLTDIKYQQQVSNLKFNILQKELGKNFSLIDEKFSAIDDLTETSKQLKITAKRVNE